MLPRTWLVLAVLVLPALSGCAALPESEQSSAGRTDIAVEEVLRLVPVEGLMRFAEFVVVPAVGLVYDLYEPTVEVSDTGTIYVAGHVIGIATTGTPAYFSRDGGATWEQLPFVGSVSAPSPVQGSSPPPGDEGVIVAGANGQAWMADIYLAGFSVTGWCNDGARQCYDNRNVYDRRTSTMETPKCRLDRPDGGSASVNDRPWAAFSNDTLLLVNNGGGGPMQIGVLKVPPSGAIGLLPDDGAKWNTCASPGGLIPGVPSMRADGLFAVPQMRRVDGEPHLTVTLGNTADISQVETRVLTPFTSAGYGTLNNGFAAFDGAGTLFIGVRNNTGEPATTFDPLDGDFVAKEGRFIFTASTDGGATFTNATFSSPSGRPIRTMYMDAIPTAVGALVSWAEDGDAAGTLDWYVAHVGLGDRGMPIVSNVTLAIDDGPDFMGDVMGAAVGPDGRAHFVTFLQPGVQGGYVGSKPISVWIQQEGPMLAPMPAPS